MNRKYRNVISVLAAVAAYLWACNRDYADIQLANLARNIEVPVMVGQIEADR